MINIDTVPADDPDLQEPILVQDYGIGEEVLEESPEELLARLEAEKEDWKAQLAAMKATLEAQDAKIDEDRAKCREFIEQEELKAQIVPINKAPTRKVIQMGKGVPVQSRLPAVTERVRGVWASSQEQQNRRARSVAKSFPFAGGIGELYMQQYGCTPSRFMNNSAYPGMYMPYKDDLGRLVRPAKILSVKDASGNMLPVSQSCAIMPASPSGSHMLPVGGSHMLPGTPSVASFQGYPGVALSGGSVVSGGSLVTPRPVGGSISGMRVATSTLTPATSYNVIGSQTYSMPLGTQSYTMPLGSQTVAMPVAAATPTIQYRMA